MGVRIVLAEKEPIDVALERFKKLLERHGVMTELRLRRFFVKSTQTRRDKRFRKRLKARTATLLDKHAGAQPALSGYDPLRGLRKFFWVRTGKR